MSPFNLEKKYSEKTQTLFELRREPLMQGFKPNFYEPFGFDSEDIEELLKLALDEEYFELDFEEQEEETDRFFYATIHAVRVLALLKAVKAIEPLAKRMLEDELNNDHNEFLNDNFLDLVESIGKEAIAPLEKLLFAYPSNALSLSLIDGFEKILARDKPQWERVETILVRYLHNNSYHDGGVAFAISALIDFTQDKHIELIRDTFANKKVDLMWRGDLEDIEIELGLRQERTTPRPQHSFANFLEDENKQKLNVVPVRTEPKIGRNDPCPCGSGKKYKKCCMGK